MLQDVHHERTIDTARAGWFPRVGRAIVPIFLTPKL